MTEWQVSWNSCEGCSASDMWTQFIGRGHSCFDLLEFVVYECNDEGPRSILEHSSRFRRLLDYLFANTIIHILLVAWQQGCVWQRATWSVECDKCQLSDFVIFWFKSVILTTSPVLTHHPTMLRDWSAFCDVCSSRLLHPSQLKFSRLKKYCF